VDPSAGTNNRGALFRIRFDPQTGPFIPGVLSDFGDSRQGLLGGPPQGVAMEADGQILVRVDPGNGARVPVSDFGDSGKGPLGQPRGSRSRRTGPSLSPTGSAARAVVGNSSGSIRGRATASSACVWTRCTLSLRVFWRLKGSDPGHT
jgi:hypothetical protein